MRRIECMMGCVAAIRFGFGLAIPVASFRSVMPCQPFMGSAGCSSMHDLAAAYDATADAPNTATCPTCGFCACRVGWRLRSVFSVALSFACMRPSRWRADAAHQNSCELRHCFTWIKRCFPHCRDAFVPAIGLFSCSHGLQCIRLVL